MASTPTPARVSVLRYIAARDVGSQVRLLGLVVLGVLLGLAPIHLFRLVLDHAIPRRDTGLLAKIGAALLGLVVARAVVNYAQGVVGEQVRQGFLGGFRNELFAHLLRVSPEFYARRSVGQLMNQVQLDVGRLGMSVAWIFVEPLVHAVTVVVFTVYLVSIDPALTVLALALMPVVVLVVPRLNDRLAANGKAFTREIGAYAAAMQEAFAAIFEVQTHGTWRFEERRLAHLQARVSRNRVDEARYNAWLAVLSDLSRGVGPVLVYTYGAVLAIRGALSAGRIVAFSGALGGMYLALDRLIKYPPTLRAAQDRFDELWAFFREPQVFPDAGAPRALPAARPATDEGVEVALDGVTFAYEARHPVLRDLSLTLRPGEHVALVGRSGCGKSTVLGLVAARLAPADGEVRLAGRPSRDWSADERSRVVGVVGQTPFLFNATLRQNLLYALLRRADGDAAAPESFVDPAPWGLDGRPPPADVDARLVAACEAVGLGEDLLDLGLRAAVTGAQAGDLLDVRRALGAALADETSVERFDPGAYLARGTVAENLVFAPQPQHPDGRAPDGAALDRWLAAARDPAVAVLDLLAEVGWDAVTDDLDFLTRVAEKNPALLGELGVEPGDLAARARLAARVGARPITAAALGDETFAALARRGLLATEDDPARRARIVAARAAFGRALGPAAPPQYDPARWHDGLSVRDNLLFGHADADDASGAKRVHAALRAALEAAGKLDEVLSWGLDFEVGERGARLSGGQRQKASIARVLLKDPQLLLLDEVTASLDQRSARQVHDLVTARFRGRTVLAVTHQFGSIERFDRVVVFDRGAVVEDGPPAALLAGSGPFRALYDAATEAAP